ncbi:DUF3800 domain-containing protein [Acidithiobacillus albertensis]|uniref:DUF3800 domain-containing protein n=1 Tax=Acidithiobacillus albertensis TaxID=119978 RepID=UPI001C06E3B1|nr:DUF3800 domain-containing protein [Acidithiobacillus albertensis]
MAIHIYLDESGDLGWQFDYPPGRGGSSRYLVIAALVTPPEKDGVTERCIRGLYGSRGWSSAREKKWSEMTRTGRNAFTEAALAIANNHPEISYHAIVVEKCNVQNHIRADANKLYNYMTRLLLLDVMAAHDRVTFVPDPRSIKVQSGNSLHDYLQTELWFTKSVETVLETNPRDSKHCRNLQFVDMLAGVVAAKYEQGIADHWDILCSKISSKRLFFTR